LLDVDMGDSGASGYQPPVGGVGLGVTAGHVASAPASQVVLFSAEVDDPLMSHWLKPNASRAQPRMTQSKVPFFMSFSLS
jgi:hypothetical protein